MLHFVSDLDVSASGIVRADGGDANLYVFGIGGVPCAYPVPGGRFTLDVSNPSGALAPANVSIILTPGFLVREEVGIIDTLGAGVIGTWSVIPYARSVELAVLTGSLAFPVLVPGQTVRLPVQGATVTATAGAGGADVSLVWSLWR